MLEREVATERERLLGDRVGLADDADEAILEGLAEDELIQPKLARRALLDHFGVKTLAAFGCEDKPLAMQAASAIIVYLRDTLPVVECYERRGILRRIDGNQSISTVKQALRQAVLGVEEALTA